MCHISVLRSGFFSPIHTSIYSHTHIPHLKYVCSLYFRHDYTINNFMRGTCSALQCVSLHCFAFYLHRVRCCCCCWIVQVLWIECVCVFRFWCESISNIQLAKVYFTLEERKVIKLRMHTYEKQNKTKTKKIIIYRKPKTNKIGAVIVLGYIQWSLVCMWVL